jgi:pyruvate kinase
MMVNPIPTRAETSDVANAIFDGSDAVMLSGETAFGKYPLESVSMMDSIVREAESKREYFKFDTRKKVEQRTSDFTESICYAASYACREINADYIVVLTETGRTARIMSNFRPDVPILALTNSLSVYRQLCINWGVVSNYVSEKIHISNDLSELLNYFKDTGKIKNGDRLVVISGATMTAGGTNMLRLHIA